MTRYMQKKTVYVFVLRIWSTYPPRINKFQRWPQARRWSVQHIGTYAWLFLIKNQHIALKEQNAGMFKALRILLPDKYCIFAFFGRSV